MSEQERRKMEVRERLEQEAGGKRKKGFMTPERKKKLRVRSCLLWDINILHDSNTANDSMTMVMTRCSSSS